MNRKSSQIGIFDVIRMELPPAACKHISNSFIEDVVKMRIIRIVGLFYQMWRRGGQVFKVLVVVRSQFRFQAWVLCAFIARKPPKLHAAQAKDDGEPYCTRLS